MEQTEVKGVRTHIAARMEDRGMRLDRFLQAALASMSRKQVKRLIESGHVRLAGRTVRRADRMIAGDECFLVSGVPGPTPPGTLAASRVVYQDDDLLVVDKPAGLRTHAVDGEDREHLVGYVEQFLGGGPVHVVSRLDKETSGVVVFALRPEAAASLTEAFAKRQVGKVYRAVVHGCPVKDERTIDAPIGPVGGGRYGIRRLGRPARTRYRVLACGRYETAGKLAVLEVIPETGRTHQVRVHLAGMGHPILGDLTYGGRRVPGVVRTLLHAVSIEVPHPTGGRRMRFTAPIPEEFQVIEQSIS